MRFITDDVITLWETGGLKDSVEPYNEYEDTGTGFSFANYNAHEMEHTIDYALSVYYNNKEAWDRMVQRAMKAKLDWDRSSDEYINVFNALLY